MVNFSFRLFPLCDDFRSAVQWSVSDRLPDMIFVSADDAHLPPTDFFSFLSVGLAPGLSRIRQLREAHAAVLHSLHALASYPLLPVAAFFLSPPNQLTVFDARN